MRRVEPAAISATGLFINLPFHLLGGTSLHPHISTYRDVQWLEILHPITAVKNLYLNRKFAQRIALALLVRERVEDVLPHLPALENLFLEQSQPWEPVRDFNNDIGQFIAARKLLSHPVTVSQWDEPIIMPHLLIPETSYST